jgi:glycosyltransferase involved in cell wall biosynthesis
MKKVLVSAYACTPGMGSEEGNGWQYASLVSQYDCQVWCLTRQDNKNRVDQQLKQHPQPDLQFAYVELPALIDRIKNWGFIGMYFHYLYWQWAALRKARTLHQKHRFDLVHHVSYGSLQLGSFLYQLNIPFIFGPVGGGQHAPDSMRYYFKKYWFKEQLRTLVSKCLLLYNPGCFESVHRASYVLAWNEDTRRMIASLGRTRRVVKEFSGISQAFLPDEPILRSPKPVLELVWVGRLLPRKALELTLHGLSKVDPKLPVQLTVVGDGEMGQYIPDYLKTYKLTNRVSWVGQVSYEQVKAYYRQADVFFFTSLRDTGPTQLLEAMAFSLPVVTLDLHGQAELVNNSTGIRVPVREREEVAEKLAKAIEWMYHHPEERQTMGLNAYNFASQQTWEVKISRLIDSYYGQQKLRLLSEY